MSSASPTSIKFGLSLLNLWVFLTGVQDVYDFDPLTANPVDKHIVGVGYELAGAWYPSDGVQVGMFGQCQRGRL